MARAKEGNFDWGVIPKGGFMYPRMYADIRVDTIEKRHGDDGILCLVAECSIMAPAEYEDSKTYVRFYVGTEDDPDAEDPQTWDVRKDTDIRHKISVQECRDFLVAAGLTKGEGLGKSPVDLWDDLEGVELGIFFSKRVAKKGDRKGDEFQTMKFYKAGDREAELLGDGNGDAAPRKPKAAATAEPDEDEAPPARRRPVVEDEEPAGRRARR